MNDSDKSWSRFTRTVKTVTASALALEDVRALEADGSAQAPSENFVALAAATDGPLERIELRNPRKDLSIALTRAEGGVDVEITASGFAAIRDWRGARALLGFTNSDISATIVFNDRGEAIKFVAGADINALARDAVTLTRI